MKEQFSEQLIRKTSKTVLHAAERKRQGLFEKLTAANSEKLDEVMKNKPVFFERKTGTPREILLDEDGAGYFPAEFFDNPTEWLESQSNINRGRSIIDQGLPEGNEIGELWSKPYDISKVKEFTLRKGNEDEIEVISKRIKPSELKEISTARKAYEAGIPTPRILGEVIDCGNIYALFEKIPCLSLYNAKKIMEEKLKLEDLDLFFSELSAYEDEIDFYKLATKYFPFAKKNELNQIKKIWQGFQIELSQYRGKLNFADDLVTLSVLLKHFKEPDKDVEFRILALRENKFMQKTIEELGYKSLDELINAIKNNPEEWHGKFDKITGGYRKEHNQFKKICRNKISPAINTTFFGFNINEEIKKLKKLCKEKGVPHKDFHPRNLLIRWNFNEAWPALVKKDEPNLLIIDWEQEDSKISSLSKK